jgi:hypothetical protein
MLLGLIVAAIKARTFFLGKPLPWRIIFRPNPPAIEGYIVRAFRPFGAVQIP